MLAIGAATWVITAQQDITPGPDGPGSPPRGGQDGRRPAPPVFRALDTNRDGVIDADEIANAPAALKTLLKSGSSTLSVEDLVGPLSRRGHGPGEPGSPGGPDRPHGPGPGVPPPENQ